MVVEAAVGAHRQLPARSGSADPAHRLTQEVGGAAGGVGAALAQPGHQHVTRPGRNGEQRVIAAHARVAVVPGALLGQAVGLADRRIEVDRERRVAWSRPGRPAAGEQLAAEAVELADVAPAEAAQEGPERGRRLHGAAEHAPGAAGAQRSGVVDALAARERRGDQGQQLCRRRSPAPARHRGRRSCRRALADRDAGRAWPGGAAPHRPPGGRRRRRCLSGRGRSLLASNGCSLWLVRDLSKTIVPATAEHPTAAARALLFGGFDLMEQCSRARHPSSAADNPDVAAGARSLPGGPKASGQGSAHRPAGPGPVSQKHPSDRSNPIRAGVRGPPRASAARWSRTPGLSRASALRP